MKILILASSFSGLCQRVLRELTLSGHDIEQHYGMKIPHLNAQLAAFQPELIICPFLVHRVPQEIWEKYPCLIVHPGIEGDRGASSLDWTITNGLPNWGVTLLQAAEEMDAGDIWGTANFSMRPAGKTSLYKREVSSAAVKLIKQAIKQKQSPDFNPKPLNYDDPKVAGSLQNYMVQTDRKIDWQNDNTNTILAKIRAADTSPGVLDEIAGRKIHLYGAIEEPTLEGKPGELIAIRYGAVCRATIDGAVWIRQLKCIEHPSLPAIKLPAQTVLASLLSAEENRALLTASHSETPNDIRIEQIGAVAYIYFDFYNGAASSTQCLRLCEAIRKIKRQPGVQTLVFMGGEDFFNNGIHLNCIEAADSPAQESWKNINAINDVVKEIIESTNHLTIAALRNNAGAGGAVVAAACDKIVIREGVVLNPHYKKMGLYGSEYWTYLLPRRVGQDAALRLTNDCEPMLAIEAIQQGLADEIFSEDWHDYHISLNRYAETLTRCDEYLSLLKEKQQTRFRDEVRKPLELYRQEELQEMRKIFFDESSQYHLERRLFVYKGKTPAARPQADMAIAR